MALFEGKDFDVLLEQAKQFEGSEVVEVVLVGSGALFETFDVRFKNGKVAQIKRMKEVL